MKTLNPINPVRRHLKHPALSIAAALGALALSAGSGDAAAVSVGNPSFENGTAVTAFEAAQAPWMRAGSTSNGIAIVPLSDIPGTTDPNPDGTNTVHFTNLTDHNVYQVLADTLAANTTYTLKVDVGDRNDLTARTGAIRLGYVSASPTGDNDYGLNLLSATVVTNTVPVNGAGASDGWITWESTFTTGASPAGLGQALRIELVTDGGEQTLWDNVRLDAASDIAGPVNDAMSTVTAIPTAVVANGVSASTVKVTLKDASGVRVPNKQVTFANNGGLTPPSALTTNAQGEASFSVSSSTVGTVVFTATVVADSLTLTDTASVEFTDPEAPVAFNVNFHTGSPASGLLGVVGGSGETWNQGTISASNLIDSTGTVASSVNVTGLPDGGDTVSAALNVFDANRCFFGKGQDTTLSITGLVPDTAYDLYIYALSHHQPSWGNSTDSERAAGDFVTSNTVQGNGQSQWLDNGKTGTNGDNFVANGNYIVFQSIVSNGSGNISILVDAYDGLNGVSGDGDGDCRLHISGLQIRPATGMSVDYMNWRSASYPGLGLPDADDDGDGLNNNFEYIFGLNPTSGASASPYPSTLELGSGFFRYTRRAKSLINMDYKVWYSTNLQNWFVDNAANQIVESTSNGVELVGVDIDPELLGENKLFIQIRTTPVTGVDPEPALINLWGSGNTITLLFSKPMNPSSATNPDNYAVTQDGAGTLNITTAVLSPDGGSVTLTLASALGNDTGYTVNLDRLTSGTGQSLGTGISRQFKTWDDNPNGIKVFILAGQSNMVGYGEVETGNGGVAGAKGSLRYLAVNDASYPDYNYASLLTTPSQPATSAFRTRSDVKVWWRDGGANLGGTVRKGDLGPPFKGADNVKIGPEFAFGHVIGDFYPTNNVLLVKIAWGGRSLVKDFRPPSAVAARGGRVGDFFSAIIDYTRDVLGNLDTEFPEWSGQGYQIVGFGWHQGYNDMIDATASAEYKNNLPDLIKDVRTVFGKPNLPFVIATTAMDNPGPVEPPPYTGYRTIEKAQLWVAGVPKPANVLSKDARPFWRDAAVSPSGEGYHWSWNAESYFLIGKSLGDEMKVLLTP